MVQIKGDIPFKSDKYHVFIILGAIPNNIYVVATVNGTTQYAKRRFYYKEVLKADEDDIPLVYIKGGKYKFFPKDTCIDCSQVAIFDLSKIKPDNLKHINDEIAADDFSQIIDTILSSKFTSDEAKRIVKLLL